MNVVQIFELLSRPGRDRRPFHDQILNEASALEIAAAFQACSNPLYRCSLSYLLLRRVRAELYIESPELEQVVPILISALEDPDEDVRVECADALGYLAVPMAGAALFKQYQQSDDDSRLRFVLATAMAACQYKEAIPVLIEALSSSDPGLRRQASLGLLILNAREAIEPLKKALAAETDPFPKQMMEINLQKLEHECMFDFETKEEKIAHLIATLKEAETDQEREQAAEKLTYLTSKQLITALIPLLHHEKAETRKIAASMFAAMTYTGTFLLIQQQSEKVQGPLIQLLHDRDPKLRAIAADALGVWGGKEAIGPLLAMMNDKHFEVRLAAIQTIGDLYWHAEGQTLEPLVNVFFSDADFSLRYNAAIGLKFLKDDRPVAAMIEALKAKESKIRQEAVLMLSALQDERAVDGLINALQDCDQEVRREAIEALWQLCPYNANLSHQAEEKMRQAMPLALLDEDQEVRDSAKKILDWLK